MKKIYLACILLLCARAFGQAPTPAQQKDLFAKIDTLVGNYLNYSKFVNVQATTLSNYTSLFTSSAHVPNDMRPAYFNGDSVNPYRLPYTTAAGVAKSVRDSFPDGFLIADALFEDVDYSGLAAKKQAKVLLVKRMQGRMVTGLRLQNQDTLVLTLQVNDDYSSVKIADIKAVGYTFKSLNDRDGDLIADDKDACPELRDFRNMTTTHKPTGCRTDWEIHDSLAYNQCVQDRTTGITGLVANVQDLQKQRDNTNSEINGLTGHIERLKRLIDAPPHFWFTAGVSAGIVNSNITSTGGGLASGTLGTTFSAQPGFGGDVQASYFFGQDKEKGNFGFGIGLSYHTFSGTLTLNNYKASIYDVLSDPTSRQSAHVTQIISLANTDNGGTIAPITEKVTLSSLQVPITAIFKGKLSYSLNYQFEAGIVYGLQSSGTMNSNSNAKFDYEAVYAYDSVPKIRPGTIDPSLLPNETFNITYAQANRSNYPVKGAAYLNLMGSAPYNYPVGAGVSPTASATTSSATFKSGSIGILLRAGISYHFSETFAFNVMAYVQTVNYTSTVTNYRLITPYFDGPNYKAKAYNTLLNGISQMTTSMLGVRVGITHALFYNVNKWRQGRGEAESTLNDKTKTEKRMGLDLADKQQRLNTLKNAKPCEKPDFMN